MKLRSLWALAIAGAYGVAVPGHAAEVLRLEDVVARALGTHPSVRQTPLDWKLSEAGRAGRHCLRRSCWAASLKTWLAQAA